MFTNEDWRSKMQGASAAIDGAFGERFTICPCDRQPNQATAPARDAPAFEIAGVFSYRSEDVFRRDTMTRQHGGTSVQSRKPIITVSHRACPVMLCIGDVLTRMVDGTQWDVTHVAPDGVARITLDVVQRGVQRQ